jgi:SET domain-containing protein
MSYSPVEIDVVDVPKYLPECMEIRYSKIPNAGLGIFAKTNIKAGTFLGNYMGKIIEEADKVPLSEYIYHSTRYSKNFWIDATELETSNFARFLNCSSSNQKDKENVLIVRYIDETKSSVYTTKTGRQIDIQGYIFMYAGRDIAEGEEMLYNYGEKYRKKLGI